MDRFDPPPDGVLDPAPAIDAARSPWLEAWRVFRQNRAALVGLALLLFILCFVLIGPLVYDVDPFEIVDALGDAPDIHCLPVGNAGNISAYWMGFGEYRDAGRCTRLPRMMGFQAEGAAPLVRGEVVTSPETVATAIRIGNPASWELAVTARDESGGSIQAVTDDQILAAYHLLAASEGFFVEPASAASVAGLLQAAERGQVPAGSRIVCTVTGNGLKDTQWALKDAADPVVVPVDVHRAAEALGLA